MTALTLKLIAIKQCMITTELYILIIIILAHMIWTIYSFFSGFDPASDAGQLFL